MINGEATIKFKGLVQTWFSYSQQGGGKSDGLGFTLNTARLMPTGSFSEKLQWGITLAWEKQVGKLLDAYLDYHFSKHFKLRVGQYVVPGALGALASSSKLDFVERAMVIGNWSDKHALYGLRGVGVQLFGDIIEKKLSYAVMVANPNTNELLTQSVKAAGYSHLKDGLAFWGRLDATIARNWKAGVFGGTGKERHTNFIRDSYGANLCYLKAPVNIKVEFIAGRNGEEGKTTKYNGMYALLGYKSGKFEPIAQYDFYSPGNGSPDSLGVKRYNNIIFGVNYYHSDNIKVQANYVARDERMVSGLSKIKNNLFYLNLQYVY